MQKKEYYSHKKSYGIACFRYNVYTRKPEILLVQKRYTYCFVEFVLGHYSKDNYARLSYLFNHMTANEKLDILSLNFGVMWYRIWLINPDSFYNTFSSDIEKDSHFISNYHRKKKKFQNTFLSDGGKKLKQLINKSKNIEPIWEIPKGRQDKDESYLESAIREFREETGIEKHKYLLLSEINPIIYSYVNMKVKYTNMYYIALFKCKSPCPTDNYFGTIIRPVIRNDIDKHNFSEQTSSKLQYKLNQLSRKKNKLSIDISFKNTSQIAEVVNIQWASLDQLKLLDKTGQLKKIIEPVFKTLKKHYKIQKYYY